MRRLKIAFRTLKSQKTISLINVLGLSLSVALCLLIFLFVRDEKSFDRYHQNADRIYRVVVDGLWGDTEIKQVGTNAQLAATLVNEFPEVEAAFRIYDYGYPVIDYQLNSYTKFRVLGTDSSIFKVFTIPIIQGSAESALKDKNAAVITKSMAKTIFGNIDPMYRIIQINENRFMVSAVIEDIPSNSHIQFDMLTNLAWQSSSYSTNWMLNNWKTYFLLRENSDTKNIESRFQGMLKEHLEWFSDWLLQGNHWDYQLQALTDIHLNSHLTEELEHNGDRIYIYLFSALAIFFLILACTNFINLTTAKSWSRHREVGVRKVFGSSRGKLVSHFLTESTLISLLGVGIGIIMTIMFLPGFNKISGKNLHFSGLISVESVVVIILLVLFTGIISGSIPAYFMASNKTLNILKTNHKTTNKGVGLRESLVVSQFIIIIIILACTFLVNRQLKYIQDKKLGFNKENIITVNKAYLLTDHENAFKSDLMRIPNIRSVSFSYQTTISGFSNLACQPEEKSSITLNVNSVDQDFLKTYEMEMVAGQFFSEEYSADSKSIIINESAANLIGYANPIGKTIDGVYGGNRTIIGVINDFNYESVHTEIRPACFIPTNQGLSNQYISIKVSGTNLSETIRRINTLWSEYTNGVAFDYSFLDKEFERMYEGERRTRIVLFIFSLLTVFIACSGLFSLSIHAAQQRIKEIGIRKVNGAKITEVMSMLNTDLVKWVVIAFVIACPISWIAMNKWLQSFAYKTNLSWLIFALTGILTLVIALLTVSWQSWRAATKNPVEALRYE